MKTGIYCQVKSKFITKSVPGENQRAEIMGYYTRKLSKAAKEQAAHAPHVVHHYAEGK